MKIQRKFKIKMYASVTYAHPALKCIFFWSPEY